MRRLFIAGNWKMNLDRASAIELAGELAKQVEGIDTVDVAVCPPAIYLEAVGSAVCGTKVGFGAQNMYFEPNGAFTGEISPTMLCDIGCDWVILGHSERRQIFGETDELINKKVQAALQAGLGPIVCVGETLQEREADKTIDVIQTQVDGSLADLTVDEMKRIVIAYEPVWAIGTGKTATPEQAEQVHVEIRKMLAAKFGEEVAQVVRIQYGGSVNGDNAVDLLGQPNIDGALVGGASLTVEKFMAIISKVC